MSPVATSPFSAQSDGSFECEHGQEFGGIDDIDLGDINLKGLTEEQLVSLTARDLNRLLHHTEQANHMHVGSVCLVTDLQLELCDVGWVL